MSSLLAYQRFWDQKSSIHCLQKTFWKFQLATWTFLYNSPFWPYRIHAVSKLAKRERFCIFLFAVSAQTLLPLPSSDERNMYAKYIDLHQHPPALVVMPSPVVRGILLSNLGPPARILLPLVTMENVFWHRGQLANRLVIHHEENREVVSYHARPILVLLVGIYASLYSFIFCFNIFFVLFNFLNTGGERKVETLPTSWELLFTGLTTKNTTWKSEIGNIIC